MFDTVDPIDVRLGEDGQVHLGEPGHERYLCRRLRSGEDERVHGSGTLPSPGCLGCFQGDPPTS